MDTKPKAQVASFFPLDVEPVRVAELGRVLICRKGNDSRWAAEKPVGGRIFPNVLLVVMNTTTPTTAKLVTVNPTAAKRSLRRRLSSRTLRDPC